MELKKYQLWSLDSQNFAWSRWSGFSFNTCNLITTHPIFIFIAFLSFSERVLNFLPWSHMSLTPPSMCIRTLKHFQGFLKSRWSRLTTWSRLTNYSKIKFYLFSIFFFRFSRAHFQTLDDFDKRNIFLKISKIKQQSKTYKKS